MSPVKTFGAVDFAVFVGMLLVTIIIGIYHAYKDREKKSIANYYFGGGKMSPIPLGLSIAVTFISAINIIGFPAETYLFGTAIFWFCFIIIVPTIVACLFHIPMVHRLKLVSIYQYLELRFDKKLRQACSAIMLFIMIVFIGLTIYVPGLALNAVTPLGLEWTIVLTSFVCTLYTALGGMKAVVWTDTLQTFIMLAGCLAALIKTTVHVGGFGNIWAALDRGNRLNFWNFTTDPTVRNSFWSICVGTSIAASNPNQAITQRHLSCESIKKARMAAMVAIVPHFVFSVITILTGCAMYAYYEGCDPIMDKRIAKPDQMMPYLVVDVFNDVPGMAGLFVSAAFSATLSTVSSGINSLAALLLEDFVLHRYPKLSSTIQVTLSKGIVIGLGVLVMCFALTIKYFNGTIIQIAFTLGGTLGGPVLAVFTLGMFFPWANTKGTAIGQIVSTVLTGALAICGIVYGNSSAHNRAMPLSTAECTTI
ncbi:unnamed protein product [Clavelina lepadiformis]|uniref:Sodium-coupled monocarboxylate transporter 1 n=1 Tax=Clavelina lepadiformis TaxID=159417 RepID=A0ABP0FUQ1_CLALP